MNRIPPYIKLTTLVILYTLVGLSFVDAKNDATTGFMKPFSMMWDSEGDIPADVYTAFRGGFTLDSDTDIDMLVSGSSWYVIWLNGEYFFEGPDRYHPNHP